MDNVYSPSSIITSHTIGDIEMIPKVLFSLTIFVVTLCCLIFYQDASAQQTSETRFTFEDIVTNSIPKGWKSDATNKQGTPSEWGVIEDYETPNGVNILALRKVEDNPRSVFNICWTPEPIFLDGEVEVKVRGDFGKMDQGGGPIWRVKDASNYYVARYNPLENNFRLYYVKDGDRKMIADAGNIPIKAGEWFTVKILHQGDNIEGWLNGKKLLEATDKTLQEPGGVGVWTKADAASSFDDFVVQSAAK
jgi:hypothetical protein